MATTASPAMARSNSRRQSAFSAASIDRSSRGSTSLQRPPSNVDSQPANPASAAASPSSQAPLAAVARKDHETTNLARAPSTRRSESREVSRAVSSSGQKPDGSRSGASHTRGDSRSEGAGRYSTDHGRNTTAAASASQSSSARPRGQTPAEPSPAVKRRTTIAAQTGTWTLGKTIGAGSMGKVKIAKNMETGEQVAIKIVPRQSMDEHHSQRERERADHSKEVRTAREAAIVSLLNHPYICGMRDVVRTNYHWYMLFEYVNGGQMLDFIISHGRLKEKQARKFGRQIASALDYCHRNSIVHRDLKIENILISKTGDIKIIDFGLSNLFSPRSHLKTFCGSLYFAAPELLQAREYTGPEVDVWSFGIVLYVLVCGKVPFDDQSMPQLHAKIKKGIVEYPHWLSAECKHLLSRMLVTDPRQRAPLSEIVAHPWMTKGFNVAPEPFLPPREPLQLPLDKSVVAKMTGFDFGPGDYITRELTKIIESEEYQQAARSYHREVQQLTPGVEKRRGVFDFYRRRNSMSRDTPPNSSSEAVPTGSDPTNAYSPLLSIYYLVREKQERERQQTNPGALSMPTSANEKPLAMPDLPAPQAAHTNSSTYEMPGEKATGGRSRPRARTHGEDDQVEAQSPVANNATTPTGSPAIVTTTAPAQSTSTRRESMAGGLLRRFSTRKSRENNAQENQPPPALQLQPPSDTATAGAATAPLRKSFSIRRSRNSDQLTPTIHSAGSQPQQGSLLSPPDSDTHSAQKVKKALGRSTSVNSGDKRRRSQPGTVSDSEAPPPSASIEPPLTSGSDRSSLAGPRVKISEPPVSETKSTASRSSAGRTRSLGHARRDSIQARRARREEGRESNVPEETDQDLAADETDGTENPADMKPVFLKGLFSVSTTSSKPLPTIRNDIIRVLRELGVEYTEVKGGFSCRHAPSIDLNRVTAPSPSGLDSGNLVSPTHRRRISFTGFKSSEREREREEVREAEKATRHHRRNGTGEPDASFTNSEYSDEDREGSRRRHSDRVAGETTTHVQNDLGENMVLKFEILIVKVPLFSLHGVQFKKLAGGTWQYKNMASKILDGLRL